MQAQAEAYVSCETTVSGKANAKACGLSAAYAEDSADAWAGAFAAALAVAVTDCSCATDAVYAYADASVAVKLWADAHAFATAAACAEGALSVLRRSTLHPPPSTFECIGWSAAALPDDPVPYAAPLHVLPGDNAHVEMLFSSTTMLSHVHRKSG